MFFFFKQKTAYEMRISDWSSDVCSSDLQNIIDLHATIQQTSIIVLVVALLLAVLVSFLLYRSITSPLRDFMRFVEQVGGGDLTKQMERLSGDELGKLGGHLNDMVAGLKEVATQIRGATENLNASEAEMQADRKSRRLN